MSFQDVYLSDSDLEILGQLVPLWEGRFGDDALQRGGIVAWSSDGPARWEQVIREYLAHYAPHIVATDFEHVRTPTHRAILLQQLYVFDQPPHAARVVKVAEPVLARAFSSEVERLVGDSGAVYSNTSHRDPFEHAPEYDLSTAAGCHFARSACAIFLTSRFVGCAEVLFNVTVEP